MESLIQCLTSTVRLIPFSEPGFTKRNELNLGRLAMLGFMSGTIVEVFTGKGPLGESRHSVMLHDDTRRLERFRVSLCVSPCFWGDHFMGPCACTTPGGFTRWTWVPLAL